MRIQDCYNFQDFRRLAKRRPAGPARPKIAANDDAPSIGGLIYSLGAIVLATHWPGKVAKTFGYHETWHTMTVLAATCHYVVILRVVLELR